MKPAGPRQPFPIPNWRISSGKSLWNNLLPEEHPPNTHSTSNFSPRHHVWSVRPWQYCNCLLNPLLELGFTHEALRLERIQTRAMFSRSPLVQLLLRQPPSDAGPSLHNEPGVISFWFRQGNGSTPLWRGQGRDVPGWSSHVICSLLVQQLGCWKLHKASGEKSHSKRFIPCPWRALAGLIHQLKPACLSFTTEWERTARHTVEASALARLVSWVELSCCGLHSCFDW